ncbi:alpha/beta hydrolase [Rhodovarius sp.]|uniref:alpha/beta fold hydrolase n=1 Tax=Rhodovarius sp. TaxID=2972673 RepID=UPI003340DFF6
MEYPRTGSMHCPFEGGAVSLRWHEWGPASGKPVVCVHGLTRNGRDFDVLAQALAVQGRRVICPDIPGRGISGWLPAGMLYAVPTYVAVLTPLLAELGDYDWVGTSMGGLIGMGLVSLPFDRLGRMVLNDIGPFIPEAALARIRDYLSHSPPRFANLAAVEAHLRLVHAPFGSLSDAQWRHMAEHSARMTADGAMHLHYDPRIVEPMQAGPLSDVDLWALWDWTVSRPLLVLRGEHSDLLTAETAARMDQHGNTTLATIKGCGHAPALMAADQVKLIVDFLAG